nr:unnamed protein product [Callosobruchus chinensis]
MSTAEEEARIWKLSRRREDRARKYFSPSNLLTLYKAQIRPSLEYCSHIWGAASPTTLSILDAVKRRAIQLLGDPALTCHLQPLSQWRAGILKSRVYADKPQTVDGLIANIRREIPAIEPHLCNEVIKN